MNNDINPNAESAREAARQADGKFGTQQHDAPPGGTGALNDTDAVPVGNLVPNVDDTYYVDAHDMQSDAFDSMSMIRADKDTVVVNASTHLGFKEGLADHGLPKRALIGTGDVALPFRRETDDELSERQDDWLNEHNLVIEAFMEDEYGAELSGGSDDWDWVDLDFHPVTVSPDTSTDEIVETLERETKAIALYNESAPGTYGCRNMWAALGDRIKKHDEDLDEAVEQYIRTALWSSVVDAPIKNGESWADAEDGDVVSECADVLGYTREDMDEDTVKSMRKDVERFMIENRHLLAEAHRVALKKGQYDVETGEKGYPVSRMAHDLWLTKTRQGAGFWDRSLGEVGDKLTEQANKLREDGIFVGDDGKVYES